MSIKEQERGVQLYHVINLFVNIKNKFEIN